MIPMTKKDIRLSTVDFEVRELPDEPQKIVGYALKFNRESENLGGFTEIIDANALAETDMNNVVALLNHDANYVLGRSGKNLDLIVDDIGLKFEFTPNDTSYVDDLIKNMRSGFIDKCSFAFTTDDDKWEERENGYLRTINKIKRLYDISIVTSPAYPDTEVVLSQRSIDKVAELNREERERALLDIEVSMY